MPDADFPDSRRLRANRRVVEAVCVTCGRSFRFGEEVSCCLTCGQFQHLPCWEGNTCPHMAAAPALAAAAAAPAPEPRSAPASPPAPPPAPLLPPDHSRSDPRPAPPPAAIEGAALQPDEQRCPYCAAVIKKEALRCRFCQANLDERLKAAEIPPADAKTAASNARDAIIYGILGMFICAPVFGSMAVSSGKTAIEILDRYPLYDGPRGKARTGMVLGYIAWGLLILGVVIRLSSVH